MDFKMADTSERRVFCNTILLKYHDFYKINILYVIRFSVRSITLELEAVMLSDYLLTDFQPNLLLDGHSGILETAALFENCEDII